MSSSCSVPTGWTIAQIADVVEPSVEQGPPVIDVPYIDIGSIDRGSKRVGDVQRITPATAPSRARQWVRDGDVLVSMTRPNLNAVAKVPRELQCAIASTGFDVLRSRGVLPEWLYYRVRSDEFIRHACEGVQGVVYPAIRPADVRRHEFPIAPLSEQQRIADAVESYLSRLDAAITGLEQAQAKLSAHRASVLKAAVESRLVPTEAELAHAEARDYEPAEVLLKRILAERRNRWEEAELAKLIAGGKRPKDDKWKVNYREPAPPAVATLPNLPEGWCWSTIDQLTSRITSGSRDWTEHYGRGNGVFIMAQNVRPQCLDLTFKQFVDPPTNDTSTERSRVQIQDLLVTIVGANTGQVCRVETVLHHHFVCQSVALMRPVLGEVAPFVDMYLNSPNGQTVFESFMYGQGRPHLSFDHLRETPVPVPPIAEQRRIVERLEEMLSLTNDSASSTATTSRRVGRLRQAILRWAFEGKLADQDPNDEPAEKLLERIRAERAQNAPMKKLARRKKKAGE